MADRSEYIQCYKHFIENVLVRKMTDDIVKSLKHGGYDDIEKLGLMDPQGAGRLKLPDTTTGMDAIKSWRTLPSSHLVVDNGTREPLCVSREPDIKFFYVAP